MGAHLTSPRFVSNTPRPTLRALWRLIARALVGALLFFALLTVGKARAQDGRTPLELLRPTDLSVTSGMHVPLLMIYGPGPMAGVEVGWRTGTNTSLVANVGAAPSWVSGAVRVFAPVGLSLRVAPWQRGPIWFQAGIGSIPYVESIGIALPDRRVSAAHVGATLTTKVAVGVQLKGWELAVGNDANLLPSQFYTDYTGDRALPWDNTFMVWIGRQVWTRRQP